MNPCNFIDPTAVIGEGTTVWHFAVILQDAYIGTNCSIGSHCEIGKASFIGSGSRLGNGAFIPPRTTLGRNVFIGPHAILCDDKHPIAGNSHYDAQPPVVEDNASIGAGAIILPGVRIGKGAMIGAGAVVTRDVAAGDTVAGVPAVLLKLPV